MIAAPSVARVSTAARAVLAAVLLSGSAACGVQLDDEPRELSADSVPFELLESTTTTVPVLDPVSPSITTVYLVDNEQRIVQVPRRLPGEPRLRRALESLLGAPSEEELDSGLGTVIPATTTLIDVTGPADGLVTIDLSGDVTEGGPEGVRLALAQLVYTATAFQGVDEVLFQVDGQARPVPDASGESTSEPRTRSDYQELLRLPTETTTTTVAGTPSG